MCKLFAIVLAGALASPVAAQTQVAISAADAALPAPVSLTIRRLVPEVQMVFAAEDHHGRPVLNLDPSHIRVLDNGIAAPLTSLRAAAALPLRIVLLLDASDSMRPGFGAERQAALAFLRRMGNCGGAQILSLAFAAGEAAATAPVGAGVLAAPQPGGQTALYDALLAASARLQSPEPARRVLLLLSDGEDNYSQATLSEATAALQQGKVAVYSVTAHSRRLEYPGDRVLRQIAAATGGRFFLLPNYGQIGRVLAEMENELRGQYQVGFRPLGSLVPGEFHSVKLLAHGVVIRARPGYYVSPAE